MPVVAPFIADSKLVIERSMTGATGNLYCGLHEFVDMAFVLHLLRPEDQFLDVGANIGTYTLLASKVVGTRTIAIEPVPTTFERLMRNIRCNDIEAKVDVRACVAGSAPGSIWFSIDRDTMNQVVDETYVGKKQQIMVRTLDVILESRQPVLWKVDVEGFEEEVLAGATSALLSSSLQAVILEAHSPRIQESMNSAGFKLAQYDPWTRTCTIDASIAGSTTGSTEDNSASKNHLWVRDINWIQTRCKSAPKFHVLGVEF